MGDILFGLGHAALNGHLLQTGFEVSMHSREFLLDLMPMEMWELSFQLLIGLSLYDWLYDFGSLLTGQDILTGQELTEFDQAAILIGVLTFGLGDDLVKAGKALNKIKYADEAAAAAKAGQGLNRWPGAQVLRNLFEMTSVFKKGFNVGLQELANGVKQKVASVLTKSLANLGSWLKGKLNQVFSGGKLPKGNLPRSSKAATKVRTSTKLAKLDAEMKELAERAMNKYVIHHFVPDPEEISRVARQLERTLDAYEAPIKRHREIREAREMIQRARAGMRLTPAEQARAALLQNRAKIRIGSEATTRLAQVVTAQRIKRFASDAILGGIGAGGFELGHQYLTNEDTNWQDVGLAILTGTILGGSVAMRGIFKRESAFEASLQVGAGTIFNMAALVGGQNYANKPVSELKSSDFYFAALYGGLSSPVTAAVEQRSGRMIPNRMVSEAVADAVVGSAFTGSQYVVSTIYKGEIPSQTGIVGNFVGGAIGAGGASFVPEIRLPWRPATYIANDLFVPAIGTYLGGGVLPVVFEDILK